MSLKLISHNNIQAILINQIIIKMTNKININYQINYKIGAEIQKIIKINKKILMIKNI